MMVSRCKDDLYRQRLNRLRRVLTWMAAIVSTVVAIAIPAIFFATAHKYESLRIGHEADMRADMLSAFIYKHPDVWNLDVSRLEKILQRHSESSLFTRVTDAQGKVIASTRPVPNGGKMDLPHGLDIAGSAPVFLEKVVVGEVQVVENLSSITVETGWVALFSFCLAGVIFVILRSLPLRALQERIKQMQETEYTLQAQIIELEEAHDKLEKQGKSLALLTDDLRKTRDEAEYANRAKSEFLAAMSHELRTPLNAISGFSEMFIGQFFGVLGSPKYTEYAIDIRSSSEHLLQLVNDILDLSAIEAGKMELNKEVLSIHDVVRDCSRFIVRDAGLKDIRYAVDVLDSLPPLCVDKKAIKQILINLLSNSIKFTQNGGQISLSVKVSNGNHVFQVRDNGTGVPKDKLRRLTEPFVRGESDPHKAQQGSGLGLAIVKSLVELHGGELIIESEIDRGTRVTVALPSGMESATGRNSTPRSVNAY